MKIVPSGWRWKTALSWKDWNSMKGFLRHYFSSNHGCGWVYILRTMQRETRRETEEAEAYRASVVRMNGKQAYLYLRGFWGCIGWIGKLRFIFKSTIIFLYLDKNSFISLLTHFVSCHIIFFIFFISLSIFHFLCPKNRQEYFSFPNFFFNLLLWLFLYF